MVAIGLAERRQSLEAVVAEGPSTPHPRRFHSTWAARGISSLGDGLLIVALPLLATRVTHNPIAIAGVAFATRLPGLVLGPLSGVLADRFSRRRLVLIAEVARMVVLCALAVAIFVHQLVLAELYAAGFLLEGFGTIFDSVTVAVIPQLVADEALVSANSRLQVAQNSGEQFAGPALGGLLFAAGAWIPVFADGASFAASALLLYSALRVGRRAHARAGSSINNDDFVLADGAPAPGHRFRDQLTEGLFWLAHEPRIRLLCALVATFSFCQALGLAILVVYATRALHLSSTAFGAFLAISSSGNLIGAALAPRVHRTLATGATLLGAGTLAAVSFIVVGTASNVPLAALGLTGEAIAVGIGNVAGVALRQRVIPLALAGRVNAAMRSSFAGAATAATLLGGVLVLIAGPRAPFLIGGSVQLLAVATLGVALARRLAAAENAPRPGINPAPVGHDPEEDRGATEQAAVGAVGRVDLNVDLAYASQFATALDTSGGLRGVCRLSNRNLRKTSRRRAEQLIG